MTARELFERKSLMDTAIEGDTEEALRQAIFGWIPPRVRMYLVIGVTMASGLLFLLLAAQVLLTGTASAAAFLEPWMEIWSALELVAGLILLLALLAAVIDGDPLAALLLPLSLILLGVAYAIGLLDGPIDTLAGLFRD